MHEAKRCEKRHLEKGGESERASGSRLRNSPMCARARARALPRRKVKAFVKDATACTVNVGLFGNTSCLDSIKILQLLRVYDIFMKI